MKPESINGYHKIIIRPIVDMNIAGRPYKKGEPFLILDGSKGGNIRIQPQMGSATADDFVDWARVDGIDIGIANGYCSPAALSMLSSRHNNKNVFYVPIYQEMKVIDSVVQGALVVDMEEYPLFLYDGDGEEVAYTVDDDNVVVDSALEQVVVSGYMRQETEGIQFSVDKNSIQGYFQLECLTNTYDIDRNKRNMLVTFPKVSLQNSILLALGGAMPPTPLDLYFKALVLNNKGKKLWYSLDYF